MDSKSLSDVACGIFRLRKDDPHMTNSTVVDVHDDEYTTLTTVEVRSGTVVLHCLASWEQEESEDLEDEEDSEDEDDEEDSKEKTYTIASGNSVTVRATAVRLEPDGTETAEGVYQVQMMKSLD